ncbi:MAG: hypothetical protein Q7J38_04165, partial [Gallionella sp.]|nr:hypothetical protein [Gallionella sp.]
MRKESGLGGNVLEVAKRLERHPEVRARVARLLDALENGGCIQKWWTGSGFHPSPLAGEGAGERGDSVAAAKIVANTPSKLLMISL